MSSAGSIAAARRRAEPARPSSHLAVAGVDSRPASRTLGPTAAVGSCQNRGNDSGKPPSQCRDGVSGIGRERTRSTPRRSLFPARGSPMSGTDQPASAPASTADDLLVVGIGASAGGITALRRFFSRVTPDGSTAYVVILHLAPDRDSHLAEVPAGRAAVPCDPGDGERTARARPRLRHLAEPEPDAGRRPSGGGRDHPRRAAPFAGRYLLSHARLPRTARTPSASSCPAPAPTARPASRPSRRMAACRSRRTRPRPNTRTCRTTRSLLAVSIWCCGSRTCRRGSWPTAIT